MIDRALALNPSFAYGWYWSGWVRLFAGQLDLAIQHFETSMRLNPRSQRSFHLAGIGMAHCRASSRVGEGSALASSLGCRTAPGAHLLVEALRYRAPRSA